MRAFLARHKADIIVTVLLAALGLSVFLVSVNFSPEGEYIRITKNNSEAVYLPLNEDTEYPLPDGKNTVIIEDGRAYMREADCPDLLCVKTGKIRSVGERIICLPNRVVVEVVQNGSP